MTLQFPEFREFFFTHPDVEELCKGFISSRPHFISVDAYEAMFTQDKRHDLTKRGLEACYEFYGNIIKQDFEYGKSVIEDVILRKHPVYRQLEHVTVAEIRQFINDPAYRLGSYWSPDDHLQWVTNGVHLKGYTLPETEVDINGTLGTNIVMRCQEDEIRFRGNTPILLTHICPLFDHKCLNGSPNIDPKGKIMFI